METADVNQVEKIHLQREQPGRLDAELFDPDGNVHPGQVGVQNEPGNVVRVALKIPQPAGFAFDLVRARFHIPIIPRFSPAYDVLNVCPGPSNLIKKAAMKLIEVIRKQVLVLDGAMGTQIQARNIPAAAWQGREGCNEWLNLTAPDVIRSIHHAYFDAGSDAVETNSFGASPITLAEYGLSDKAFEINRAAARIAREAADACATPQQPRFVLGSIGPGTKLATLGQVSFDVLADSFQKQIEGLVDGGVNGLLIETCQDLLQIKAALVAARKVLGDRREIPVYVSVTVEQTGTMLVGSGIGAVVAALLPFEVDILGLNCATGPEAMRIHLDYLAQNWPRLVACMPNAGLPVLSGGKVHYPLGPAEFGPLLGSIAREIGLNIVGGCCGTTPDHIRRLKQEVQNLVPPARAVHAPQQVTSLFSPVDLTQEPAPLYVGERGNATGSKKFRDALLANDYDAAFGILVEQEEVGSHVVDLSCAYAGRDEKKDVELLAARAARECRIPVMIDSTQPEVIEAALKTYGGRMIVNSINFEDGGKKADLVAAVARRFGAALVCLTIDEQGMAMTADRKVQIARRLVDFCVKEHGFRPEDLFIDALTFTICSGDETLRNAAGETIAAIRRIKAEIPGVRTLLGLSNISFGLKPAGRKVLNAVFLDRCLKAGLDACIINVATIAPLNQIPYGAVKVAEALLDNDRSQGDPLENFINFFETAAVAEPETAAQAKPPEEALAEAVIKGRIPALAELIPALLPKHSAEDILNNILVEAMKEVGRLFNEGILQLPFVLKSAEVMKKAVDLLKPHMKKDDSATRRGTMVIATVAGDVHDIGKNLVDIILSNNGFEVVNLGIKCPVEKMIEAVREHRAHVLGMSGLLVKSTVVMAENLKALQAAGIRIPVFLGGAALTPGFVSETCRPLYAGSVVYCRDAFAGLSSMRELMETGRIEVRDTEGPVETAPSSEPAAVTAPIGYEEAPAVPFLGHRIVTDIDLDEVYPYLNETVLVRGRWGYRRGKLSADDYRKILENEVRPRLEKMKRECKETNLLKPQVAYGYFRCRGERETLYVSPEKEDPIPLIFPRQQKSPFLSIPDFFRRDGDIAGFMVVTLGSGLESENVKLLAKDHYQDYFLLHGFAVEVTDALAEYWHARMRKEMGFRDLELNTQDYVTQKYRGSRYGFGYPACPDLSMNKVCCDLVQADAIRVAVTENFMMAPELTTCALIAHHPRAKYFSV